MSTSYNRPVEGVTSLRLEEGPGHDRLTIWIEHGNAGTLTVPLGWGKRLAKMFSSDSGDDSQDAMRTHWGGKDIGAVVTDNAHLPDDAILISEYGEVLTAGDVRGRAGARRAVAEVLKLPERVDCTLRDLLISVARGLPQQESDKAAKTTLDVNLLDEHRRAIAAAIKRAEADGIRQTIALPHWTIFERQEHIRDMRAEADALEAGDAKT